MENCNHRYKGDTCIKCGHKRASNSKTPQYKVRRMEREIMAEIMNRPPFDVLGQVLNQMKY